MFANPCPGIGGSVGLYSFNSRPRDVFSYLARISWKFD
jgi:hypothetical protein